MAVLTGVPALETFYVYLTSGCNCACRHCYFVPATGAAADCLSPVTLRKAIEQALPLGLQSLKWTGGEPTFHPQFREFLALQREFGLGASLESNGMLIDTELADLLHTCGVGKISISLDGALAATHDHIRGVAGGFARTCAGIRALVSAGFAPELVFTLQRGNVGEIDAFLEVARALGAGSVKLNILQPMLRGAELAEAGEALTVAELIALAGRITAVQEDAVLPVFFDIPMAFRPLHRLFDPSGCGVCGILQILGILPNGDYALCGVGQHDPALAMGAVATVRLEEVWNSHPVLVSLRAGLPKALQGICRDCMMRDACLGCCIAANYHRSRELFAPFWFCQAAADAGLFPAARRKPHG